MKEFSNFFSGSVEVYTFYFLTSNGNACLFFFWEVLLSFFYKHKMPEMVFKSISSVNFVLKT